ncbi:hypothetical protein [Pseudoxanthomonas koreensis]|uniref:hypothetical protein n=1 Tax=Pseudoxanthomonas koreensis TaxID=266061 RepID=UPI0035A7086D
MPLSIRAGSIAAACCALAMAGCRAEPPPTEQPPEPQAQTELRDAIQAPQQKAAAVEQLLQEGDARQRAAIDAAEGG